MSKGQATTVLAGMQTVAVVTMRTESEEG